MKVLSYRRLDLEKVLNWTPEQWLTIFGETAQRIVPVGNTWQIFLRKDVYSYDLEIKKGIDHQGNDFVTIRVKQRRPNGQVFDITVEEDCTSYGLPDKLLRVYENYVILHSADGSSAWNRRRAEFLIYMAMGRHRQMIWVEQDSVNMKIHTNRVLISKDFLIPQRISDKSPRDLLRERYDELGVPFVVNNGEVVVLL